MPAHILCLRGMEAGMTHYLGNTQEGCPLNTSLPVCSHTAFPGQVSMWMTTTHPSQAAAAITLPCRAGSCSHAACSLSHTRDAPMPDPATNSRPCQTMQEALQAGEKGDCCLPDVPCEGRGGGRKKEKTAFGGELPHTAHTHTQNSLLCACMPCCSV